jgi:hypothetical protein
MQRLNTVKEVKTDLDKWLLEKSVENMIEHYRVGLHKLIDGKTITDSIPKRTRKRMLKHGILRKFGSKFELTDFGMKLLQKKQVSSSLKKRD